jgi:uncharacterized membrane protein
MLIIALRDTGHPSINYRGLLFEGIMAMLLLCAESILYWVIRKRIFSLAWTIMHVVMMYLSMVLVPLVYFFLVTQFSRIQPPDQYAQTIKKMMLARYITFWSLFIVAHVFLALNIIRAFTFKEQKAGEGLLDEFSEIH